MHLSTRFPLATLFFKHWSVEDTEDGIVIAKASFVQDETMRWIAQPAPELVLEDRYLGDPAFSPLMQEQDTAPGKLGTDLFLQATARSPDGKLLPEWPVSLTVADRLHYGVQVRGPSHWTYRRLKGWFRTSPELVSEVPISYDLAFGGASPGSDGGMVTFENNPSGLGFATPMRLEDGSDFAAPQIGLLPEFMGTDPLAEMGVHGFGPIAKSWLPRRSDAGTFDDQWKETRHPRLPKDYSLAFWNAAPKALQFNPPLMGNEQLHVQGIAHDGPVALQLASVTCSLRLGQGDADICPMVLDTLALDLRSGSQGTYRVDMIWRAVVQSPERFETAEIIGHRLEN